MNANFPIRIGGRRKKQRGTTLIGAIAAMGVMSSVTVGAVSLLGSATASANANQMMVDVSVIRERVAQLYGRTGYDCDGCGNMNAALVAAGVFPTALFKVSEDGQTITDPWGGTVTVRGGSGNFSIAITQVPQDVCVLVTPFADSSYTKIRVNGNDELALPVRPETAVVDCQEGNPRAPTDMTWWAAGV